jgi:hypothetical protein
MDTTNRSCPWCSASIPAGAAACPQCHAHVEGQSVSSIPGVTEVDRTARLEPPEGLVPDSVDPAAWFQAGKDEDLEDRDAVAPPSDAVRAEMRKMELQAEIANAGSAVMGMKDEARPVGMPSVEALEALEAGIISVPAQELEERAKALEIDEHADDAQGGES